MKKDMQTLILKKAEMIILIRYEVEVRENKTARQKGRSPKESIHRGGIEC